MRPRGFSFQASSAHEYSSTVVLTVREAYWPSEHTEWTSNAMDLGYSLFSLQKSTVAGRNSHEMFHTMHCSFEVSLCAARIPL